MNWKSQPDHNKKEVKTLDFEQNKNKGRSHDERITTNTRGYEWQQA